MNKTLKSALLSAAALLIGSSAFASNMGFKLVYPLTQAGAGNDGTNIVSLPYFNSFASQTAAGAFADMPASTLSIARWNPATRGLDACTAAGCGGFGDVNFALTKGESYVVNVGTTANWTIVGSHDNAAAVSLTAAGAGNDGTNMVSVPYHTNKTNAAGIFGELPASTLSIARWNPATRGLDACTAAGCGGFGDVNFSITIGEGYVINVGTTASWTPAHY